MLKMKLDKFITSVLIDINNAIKSAKAETGRNYIVSLDQDKGGVNFDITVVACSSTTTQSGGALKAGFVEVLGGSWKRSRKTKKKIVE